MKKTLLLPLLVFFALSANAQGASSLHENFDVGCVTSSFPYGDGWLCYNPIPGTSTDGAWTCTADGRSGTPGMKCTGVYGGHYNLDSSYLISPLFNLYHFTGPVYLNFDTKADSITLGGALRVIITLDTPYSSSNESFDVTDSLMDPQFTISDSSGWVTHQLNLIRFEDTAHPFYVTFRYTSTTTTGSIWFLDNVNTTTLSYTVKTPTVNNSALPLTVIGKSTPDKITISCTTPEPGIYQLAVYDMVGRQVHAGIINAVGGTTTYTITGIELAPGMYIIKMIGGNATYGVAKAMVN